jgi:hypothetical protein
MAVACIDGSVMEPRRIFGSNAASMGGSVVRFAEGGGVSMKMGWGPVSIANEGGGLAASLPFVISTMRVSASS